MAESVKSLLARGLGVAIVALAPHAAQAQAFPTKSVRMIVGFPAGSSSDSPMNADKFKKTSFGLYLNRLARSTRK